MDTGNHNVYITGPSYGAGGTYFDFATVGYTAGGGQAWVSRYNSYGNGNDNAKWLAVDPSTHTIYVTGTSGPTSGAPDYVTVSLEPSLGEPRWAAR